MLVTLSRYPDALASFDAYRWRSIRTSPKPATAAAASSI